MFAVLHLAEFHGFRIELFRGITFGDIIVAVVTLALVALIFMSTIPGNIYIAAGILAVGGLILLRMDGKPIYVMFLGLLRFMAYPKIFKRSTSDKELLPQTEDKNEDAASEEKNERSAVIWSDSDKEKGANEAAEQTEEGSSEEKPDKGSITEKNDAPESVKPTGKSAKKTAAPKSGKINKVSDIMPFTGIKDGYIEYGGKYYGAVIEIAPVEFRFFSQYRRDASIENCLGKIMRSLRSDLSANIVKIDRPILYNSYLKKEYEKLDALKVSYEKGMFTEDELKSRIEIQYDRINALRTICFEDKIIQPFYYLVLFNSHKKQLEIDIDNAVTALQQGELKVSRLKTDRDIAIFLKYTNTLDFDEWDADKIDPKDYMQWVMPESLSFTSRYVKINRIITHQMSVTGYPADVGDAWLAGVMSVPATKVMVKITPMERTKSIKVEGTAQLYRRRLKKNRDRGTHRDTQQTSCNASAG